MGFTAEVVGLVLLLVCAVLGWFAVRRYRLVRRGAVDVALRRRIGPAERGWHLGVGRYRGDEFVWYRVTSLRAGPDAVVDRTDLEITERRSPSGAEHYAMPSASRVLGCRDSRGRLELAMAPDALTGFLSWLESGPPGRTGYRQAS